MATKQKRMTVLDQTRDAVTALLSAFDKLMVLKNEYDNGLSEQIIDATSDNPNEADYKANDFEGIEGLTKSDFDIVFSSAMDEISAFIVSANGKKLQDIRK